VATSIGFDTATEQTVVGATVEGEIVFDFHSGAPLGSRPDHSTTLLPAIEEAVDAVGGWDAVDRIAVGTGPGTFTGLRVALATAKGLGLAGAADLVGVPTLAAMARTIISCPAGQGDEGSAVVPVIDAKRGEVFFGIWGPDGSEIEPATVGPPEAVAEVASRLRAPIRVAGPGSVRFRSELASLGLKPAVEGDPANRLRGSAICEVADSLEESGEQQSLEPIYLRRPDAERWTERDAHRD
jgi:tRNA threonylcarbamoyladenosine biosynthesis protein TsaB